MGDIAKAIGIMFLVVIVISGIMSLVSCQNDPSKEWQSAADNHICTTEEMERVEQETKFCSKNASFPGSYCYGTAIIRNCEERIDP